MPKKKKILNINSDIEKKSFIWNMLASVVYSVQSPLLLLVITRRIGLYEGGVFSVIYSLVHMFTNVGLYNMRSYQVSDVKDEYKFSDYYSSRIVTTIFMIIFCLVYSAFNKYDLEKFQLVVLWLVYRSIETMEDVYHSEVQKRGRLDIVSKIVFIRITTSILIFIITLYIWNELIWATSCLVISTIVIYFISNWYLKRNFDLKGNRQYKKTYILLYTCFPVFMSSFLYSYFVNAPKYAIDTHLSPEVQSVFAIIFLPNMIINMIGIFIFKPMLGSMGEMWSKKEIEKLKKSVLNYTIFFIIGTIVVAIIGRTIGISILALVYGVKLDEYKSIFTALLIFGGISALNNYYSIVITVIRKQKYLLVAYGIGLFLCLTITDYIVKNYKIVGAAWSYGIVMISMFVIMSIIIMSGISKKKTSF